MLSSTHNSTQLDSIRSNARSVASSDECDYDPRRPVRTIENKTKGKRKKLLKSIKHLIFTKLAVALSYMCTVFYKICINKTKTKKKKRRRRTKEQRVKKNRKMRSTFA